ncbi:MAG: HEPN domain-containing protein [Tannerella sp.]|jgi:HEPN domain-containing protein|nr:HEPN domain-containing protein [Tannerella sp.]
MANDFDVQKIIDYWIESSDEDYKTMHDLFHTKNYSWALFIGHLVIEKLLKAYYAKIHKNYPPMLHDLRRIGEKAGIVFDDNKLIIAETISQFNIRARYDDYKRDFQKLCTPEYGATWIENIKEIRLWIKTMLSD